MSSTDKRLDALAVATIETAVVLLEIWSDLEHWPKVATLGANVEWAARRIQARGLTVPPFREA